MPAVPKLLVLNPNTSSEVTRRFLTEARREAGARAEIAGVTGSFGARIVSRRAENVIAGFSALDLLARHAGSFDAVILAISYDTALDALREISPIPVIGMTSAAVAAAATAAAGGGVGMIVFGTASRPLYEDLVRSGAVGDAVCAMQAIDVGDPDNYLTPGALDERTFAQIELMAARPDVKSIVLCGAAITGMAARLAARSPLPLFDGAGPSVRAALATLSPTAPRPAPVPAFSASVGLSPELEGLLAGAPVTGYALPLCP